MSTDGILEYQGTKRVLYRGDTSNIVFDTRTTSLGIGVTGSNNPSSNLYITGNAYVSSNLAIGGVMTMGVVNVAARHNLQAVTAIGNVTTQTVEFTNPTTAFTTTGNVSDLNIVSNVNMLHTANTAAIKLNSNVVTEFPRSKKLIKYPRVALTSDAETGSGYQGYIVTRSSQFSTYNAWEAFDENNPVGGNTGAGHGWASTIPGNYSVSTGAWGGGGTPHHTGSTEGEWIQIQLPDSIYLHDFVIESRSETTYGTDGYDHGYPKDVVLYGSINGSSWDTIKPFTTGQKTFSEAHIENINETRAYKYFALVVNSTRVVNNTTQVTWTSIGQIRLFGIPEYDPEAYGTDVTIKSETNVPNTDWLEVYYDAKNYSGSGDVQDETTNNRDAEMNATFDNGEIKAFNFTGAHTSNVTTSDHGLGTGDVTYTVSYWFKRTQRRNNYDYLYIAGSGGTTGQASLMWINSEKLHLDHWGTATKYDEPIQNNRWYHVAAGHKGGPAVTNDFLYVDGQNVGVAISSPATFNLQGTKLTLGTSHNTTNEFLEGSIANFRLFNRALTSDEIYQLYAYQKEYFGHGDLSMTLKAGRLGIGTSEPRAALDVRGDIHANGAPAFPIPVATFYKLSASTTNTTHDENIRSGWVAFTGANTITPGVIEAYTLSGGTTTQGTSSGVVVKLCKKGMYKLEAGFAINTQSGINSHIGIGIYPVSDSYIPGNNSRVHYTLGGAGSLAGYFYIPGATNNINQQFRMTEILRVSEGPGYAYVTMTPNSNDSTHFQFQNWANYPHGVMYVTYLG